jgi:hypothetical protein
MTIATRDDLIAVIKDYSLRSDAPVASLITVFETEIRPRVEHSFYSEQIVDLPIVAGKVTLPADFKRARFVKVDNYETRQLGIRDSLTYHDEVGYRQVGREYHFVGRTDIEAVQIVYTAKIAPLTESDPTNWLLTEFPNVYLQGVLARLYQWAKDDVAEASAKQALNEALALVAEDDRQARIPAAPSEFGGAAAW